MIYVCYNEQNGGALGVTIEGHANAAEKGEDVVCVMVTGLTYTLAQNVKDNRRALKGRPKIKLEEGNAVVKCRPIDKYRDQIKTIFGVICRGYRLIAANFPDNVSYDTMCVITPARDGK